MFIRLSVFSVFVRDLPNIYIYDLKSSSNQNRKSAIEMRTPPPQTTILGLHGILTLTCSFMPMLSCSNRANTSVQNRPVLSALISLLQSSDAARCCVHPSSAEIMQPIDMECVWSDNGFAVSAQAEGF